MALTYYAGWDFARLGEGVLEFTDNTGTYSTDSANTYSTGTYAHLSMETITGSGSYAAFATHLDTTMETLSAAAPGHFTVTYSETTGFYTFTVASGTLTFTANTNTVMRNILGLATSGAVGGGSSVTSTRRAYYGIIPTVAARSNVTDDYEGGEIAFDGEADDGSVYGISRTTAPLYHDWVQAMESKEASFKNSASATVPFTYQHMFEHCRNIEPIMIKDSLGGSGTDDMVVKLRADGSMWKPQRVTADYDGQWNIPFNCRVVTTSAGVSRA